MAVGARYRPDPRILELDEGFWDVVEPARFPDEIVRFRNDRWAARVGLDGLDEQEWIRCFARFEPLPDNIQQPLAMRYHGHQFGAYNPRLGDGRGFLYAQMRSPDDERLLDLSTKGSGRTPYCRTADGRLTLKGGVREILATEMLEALGVSTSKTVSVIETGEALERHDEPSPTRACVLVRLGHSHIRFGTFQRHAYHRDTERLRKLLDWCIAVYFPHIEDASDRPAAFVREVSRRNAELCASWMVAGFVHGVLNTDNMLVTGESFDYGPWRFLPRHEPNFTAAYFDETGFYAFGRQPSAVHWDLQKLVEALQPLAPELAADRELEDFESILQAAVSRRLLRRLGVSSVDPDTDAATVGAAMEFTRESGVGFAQFFHDWYGGTASEARAMRSPGADAYAGPRFEAFRRAIGRHAPAHPERLEDPYFERARPCDLLVDEVEELWRHIAEDDDWGPLHDKIADIRSMGALLRLDEP